MTLWFFPESEQIRKKYVPRFFTMQYCQCIDYLQSSDVVNVDLKEGEKKILSDPFSAPLPQISLLEPLL